MSRYYGMTTQWGVTTIVHSFGRRGTKNYVHSKGVVKILRSWNISTPAVCVAVTVQYSMYGVPFYSHQISYFNLFLLCHFWILVHPLHNHTSMCIRVLLQQIWQSWTFCHFPMYHNCYLTPSNCFSTSSLQINNLDPRIMPIFITSIVMS